MNSCNSLGTTVSWVCLSLSSTLNYCIPHLSAKLILMCPNMVCILAWYFKGQQDDQTWISNERLQVLKHQKLTANLLVWIPYFSFLEENNYLGAITESNKTSLSFVTFVTILTVVICFENGYLSIILWLFIYMFSSRVYSCCI